MKILSILCLFLVHSPSSIADSSGPVSQRAAPRSVQMPRFDFFPADNGKENMLFKIQESSNILKSKKLKLFRASLDKKISNQQVVLAFGMSESTYIQGKNYWVDLNGKLYPLQPTKDQALFEEEAKNSSGVAFESVGIFLPASQENPLTPGGYVVSGDPQNVSIKTREIQFVPSSTKISLPSARCKLDHGNVLGVYDTGKNGFLVLRSKDKLSYVDRVDPDGSCRPLFEESTEFTIQISETIYITSGKASETWYRFEIGTETDVSCGRVLSLDAGSKTVKGVEVPEPIIEESVCFVIA